MLKLVIASGDSSARVCNIQHVVVIPHLTSHVSHTVLSAAAAVGDVTDRKFAVKARLCQSLGITLAVIRSYLHSPKLLQSLVGVLKLYATDGPSQLVDLCTHHRTHLTSLFSADFIPSELLN